MIALNSNCLLFQLANGESVPCSAETICVEIIGSPESRIDPEMLRHAAASVFHYFKYDLERETVTVGEFAGALERVLRNLGLTLYPDGREREILESDLSMLARESGVNLELLFFPRLRDELRFQLRQSPRLLRFRGLRGCVKRLTQARRWSARCEALQEQIVEYLRQCLSAESVDCPLVVE
ncbi:MAG TPA: hypothetical protein VNV43_02030 [Candidatus Acidoferrales bacterium]|jgi:hypothetical protein|nr:hypothetical protein [Candidatus Acidoferrales bacterium]